MNQTITLSSSIGRFPPTAFRRLCDLLNVGHAWKKLAEIVPTRDGRNPRFSTHDVLLFEMRRDPAEALINSWMTDYVTFSTLIHWLTKAGLAYHACYVRKTVETDFDEFSSSKICPCSICADYEVPQLPSEPLQGSTGEYECLTLVATPNYLQLSDTLTSQSQSVSNGNGISGEYYESVVAQPEIEEPRDATEASETHTGMPYALLSAWTNNFNQQPAKEGGNFIGKGGCAEVFKGFDPMSKKLVAVKRIRTKNESNGEKYSPEKQLENEIAVLSRLEHNNIVKLYGWSTNGPMNCIVYEYMSSGSLDDHLSRQQRSELLLTTSQRIRVIDDTAQGLTYLHSKNFIHRDVKSANILLDDTMRAKIGDCGITRPGPSNFDVTGTQVVIGTTGYIAPEVNEGIVSCKIDAYSFGVVILEILTGLPAFDVNREDRLLVSHVQENCDDDEIDSMLDNRVSDWDYETCQQLYQLARRFLQKFRRRPAIAETLDEIEALASQTSVKC